MSSAKTSVISLLGPQEWKGSMQTEADSGEMEGGNKNPTVHTDTCLADAATSCHRALPLLVVITQNTAAH